MVSRQERQQEKGIALAAGVSDVVMVKYHRTLDFRVVTEGGRLTRLHIWRKLGEPDAAGQGGSAPSS